MLWLTFCDDNDDDDDNDGDDYDDNETEASRIIWKYFLYKICKLGLCLTTFYLKKISAAQNLASNRVGLLINETKWTWEEAIVVRFEVPYLLA
jgi:hypothetical protein